MIQMELQSVRLSVRIKPDYFANGGDRKTNNTPEMDVCEELGIEMLVGCWRRQDSKLVNTGN